MAKGKTKSALNERAVSFTASLPPIQSAISVDGLGDGARIKLDVPRSAMGQILRLQAEYLGCSFLVTITPLDADVLQGG
mgnify:CR=1 FL=1